MVTDKYLNYKNKYFTNEKILLVLFISIETFSAFSQEKKVLTKEETIDYLNEKINEVNSLYSIDNRIENGHSYKKIYFKDVLEFKKDGLNSISIRYQFITPQKMDYIKQVTPKYAAKYADLVNYWVIDCRYGEVIEGFIFNPADIKDDSLKIKSSWEGPVGFFTFDLIQKTAKYTLRVFKPSQLSNGDCIEHLLLSRDEEQYVNKLYTRITFPYLQDDPGNFNKIKRALLHLKKLYQADDDPFGK